MILLLLLLFSSPLLSYQQELAVAAIFRDEAEWIEEWIAYHRLLGVEYFYLYNNDSTDDYLTLLTPYIEEGVVELIDWPRSDLPYPFWFNIQQEVYQDCLARSRGRSRWVAFIDIDEFIVPHEANTIPDFLKDYAHAGSITINWQCFGTSGYQRIPEDKFMIECLTRKADENSGYNYLCKTICQPERCLSFMWAHGIGWFNKGYKNVRPRGESGPVRVKQIQVNHYCVRTEEWIWEVKFPRAKGMINGMWHSEEKVRAVLRQLDHTTDLSILRFAEKLRESLKK